MSTIDSELRKFNKLIDKFSNEILPEQFIVFHRKISLDLLTAIVQRTPVDTGRARSNWQTTVGVSAKETIDDVSISLSGQEAINAGVKALSNLKAFAVVFISNNVNYISYLEEGTSNQAPQGMVQLSIAEMRAIFDGS